MRKKPGLRSSIVGLLVTGRQFFELSAHSKVGSYVLNWFQEKARNHMAFSERVRWDIQSDAKDGCFEKIILVSDLGVFIIFGRVGSLRVYIPREGLSHIYAQMPKPRQHKHRRNRRPYPNHFW